MNDAPSDPKRNYRDTVFPPQTSFLVRGDLPKKESQILVGWAAMDLWSKLRATLRGRPKFIWYDEPPHANGNTHIGTALDKILNDPSAEPVRLAGYDTGWLEFGNERSASWRAPSCVVIQ
jgi:isoleucyl-tRNA synthetase